MTPQEQMRGQTGPQAPHGVGAPEAAHQSLAPVVDGARADRGLWHRPLGPQGGPATGPVALRAPGTPAGTARRHGALLRQTRTPAAPGASRHVAPARE